jgi:hypothetical protein
LTGTYSARHASLGGRTIKTGQSRWFVGYKKHTLRVWLRQCEQKVVLVPLISWLAPAHRGDALFLQPSLRYCQRHLEWRPDIVVGDMAYINLDKQRQIREQMGVAVITKLRPDMIMLDEFDDGPVLTCEQGQPLQWLGLDQREELHWFGVRQNDPLCSRCWQRTTCQGEFSYPPRRHEILYGMIPLSSRVSHVLLQRVRPWIEATQSYEKNQLGLSELFLNSLRLAWHHGLLADAVALLRARAVLSRPPEPVLLGKMAANQGFLNLE